MPADHGALANSSLVTLSHPPLSMTGGAVNGTILDMQNWDNVVFDIAVGVTTGSGAVDGYVAESNEANLANSTNVTNASIAQVVNDNTVSRLEVLRSAITKRYIRLVLTQSVNTIVAGATATQYKRVGGSLPPTQSAEQVKVVTG